VDLQDVQSSRQREDFRQKSFRMRQHQFAVQDMLGHQDPKTTARYARVVFRAQSNPALKVPVEL
jgi:hypothetical protein